MADKAADETQKKLDKVEDDVRRLYKRQTKEMQGKLEGFLADFDKKNKAQQKKLNSGKITQDQYDSWLAGQAFQRKWYEEMVTQLSTDMTLADVKAMSMVKGFMPEAYAINRNFGAFEVEQGALVDTSFTLYDAHTVERLAKGWRSMKLLPGEPDPDIPKEMCWHKDKIKTAIQSGILQGETIPEIARRLQDVTGMDERAAIRSARTATTGAQNAGRVDSYLDAQKMGIKLKQRWVASLDDRTRKTHRLLDGEMVDPGEMFSNKCKYPGDPRGPAAEVYNCRCTLIAVIAKSQGGRGYVGAQRASKLGNMDYDDWKYGKDQVAKYENKVAQAQKKIDKLIDGLGNPVYTGIWKDPVTLADYPSKQGSIQAKRDYYESEIAKMEQMGLTDKADFLRGKLAELDEFEKNGKLYMQYKAELDDYRAKLKDARGVTTPFTADAYSPERKAAARKFDSRVKADKVLRPELDAQWEGLEDHQKYGVWKYTENSNPMNKPLSGYEDTWDRSGFKGVGQARWDYEDNWRSNPPKFKKFGHSDGHVDHAQAIASLTTAIDKCELAEDMWFVRGSDIGGLAGLLEGDNISFKEAKQLLASGDISTLQAVLQGQSFQSHSFMSTAIAQGSGFGGDVSYEIYAPRGTKCIYAEPQSYFGSTISGAELYKPGQSHYGVGSEAEQIMQRGTTYRITSIQKTGYSGYHVQMEVVDQPDYFKTGFEQTFDGGKTSWGKK